jgi:drug/metabolite transporter (DMT)-like permease
MLPFYVYNFNFYNELTLNLSSTSLGVILYMAVFSSIIAYILYIKAQKALEVTEVSLLAYISPIFSLPASFLILNEVPTLSAFMGLFIIFSGILIAEFSKNKAK